MSTKRQKVSTTTVRARRSTIPVAPSVRKFVNKCMNKLVEKKYLTVTAGTIIPGSSGTVIGSGLETITQGTTDSQRIGNYINLDYITVRGNISDSTVAGPPPNGYMRLILLYDTAGNGVAPVTADILELTSIFAPMNHDTVAGVGGSRFKILKTQTIQLSQQTYIAGVNTTQVVPFTLYANLKGKKTRYDASASAGTDVVSGYIYLLAIGSNATIQCYSVYDIGYNDA